MNSLPSVGLTVDIVPAILVFSLIFSAVSLGAALYARIYTRSVLYWAVGSFGVAGGILLIVLRGSIPDVLSILVANCILLAGHAAISCGTSLFAGRSMQVDIALGAAFVLAVVFSYFANANLNERSILVAAATALICLRALHGFLVAPRHLGVSIAIGVLATASLVEAGRVIVLLAQGATGVDPLAMTGLSVRMGVPVALGISLGVVAISWPAFRSLFSPRRGQPVAGVVPGSWALAADRSVLITPNGSELRLTGNEYLVLKRLGSSLDPLDRLTLNALIGRDNANPKDRGIDILLSRLRSKCAEAGAELPINSVRGLGYVFHGDLPQV